MFNIKTKKGLKSLILFFTWNGVTKFELKCLNKKPKNFCSWVNFI